MNSELLQNLDKLHTTEMGFVRIKKNLSLRTDDVIDYCKKIISSPDAVINRKGKNWYIAQDGCILTVNVYSFTVITAHKA